VHLSLFLQHKHAAPVAPQPPERPHHTASPVSPHPYLPPHHHHQVVINDKVVRGLALINSGTVAFDYTWDLGRHAALAVRPPGGTVPPGERRLVELEYHPTTPDKLEAYKVSCQVSEQAGRWWRGCVGAPSACAPGACCCQAGCMDGRCSRPPTC
jgi:hypothetical protein